jgi:prepilin-type N-terminal cleavage/methylation domain-containing protein
MIFRPVASRGFSLFEILIVIAIIGILASIALMGLQALRISSRDMQRKSDLSQIQLALRALKDVNGEYPDFRGGTYIGEGYPIDAVLLPFFPAIPKDPLTGIDEGYRYYYDSEIKCYGSANETYAMVFALKTERAETANWDTVCPMPPGGAEGTGKGQGIGVGYGNDKVDSSAYAVVLK